MFGIFVFIIVFHIGGQFNERLASLVASRSVFLSYCLCKQCFCLFLREINMMMMMMMMHPVQFILWQTCQSNVTVVDLAHGE